MGKIRVLSFNISWEASEGVNKLGWNNTCMKVKPNNNKKISGCLQNTINFINENGPYDFVGLQEASNYDWIRKNSKTLQDMKLVSIDHQPPNEKQATFYNSKYKLINNNEEINIIKSCFGNDSGRPLTILFFDNNLCVINIHAGHGGNSGIEKFDKSIEDTIEGNNNVEYFSEFKKFKTLNQYQKDQIKDKLATFNIILMGDFNHNLIFQNVTLRNTLRNTNFFFGNSYFNKKRIFYGRNEEKSCCNSNLNSSKVYSAFDHILSTSSNIITKVYPINDASDHLPIIGEIVLEINQCEIHKLLKDYLMIKEKNKLYLSEHKAKYDNSKMFDIKKIIPSLKEMCIYKTNNDFD